MAVRTGGPGFAGLSLLVVPLLGYPGVSLRRMKTSGGTTSGTTFITLDEVEVPAENLIGKVTPSSRLSYVPTCQCESRDVLLGRLTLGTGG